jgi:glycosyltransferase involved in cell wall biosynthesis
VVIPAKNESKFIEKTLKSIEPSVGIIVVDDGSSDDTALIAKKYTSRVISLPDIGINAVGKPHLAQVINTGLDLCRDNDYVCILGADHVLPPDYISNIIAKMKNDGVVVASGSVFGEYVKEDFPAGSGRVIDCSFLKEVGFGYPEKIGWEDWLIYKALATGRKVRCYTDVTSSSLRPMSYRGKGEIMYALGYYWPYAIGRCVRVFFRSPKNSLNMLKGYLLHSGVDRLDVAPWVGDYQRRAIKSKIKLS